VFWTLKEGEEDGDMNEDFEFLTWIVLVGKSGLVAGLLVNFGSTLERDDNFLVVAIVESIIPIAVFKGIMSDFPLMD